MTNPATLEDARELWADSATLDDATVTQLLAVAWERCELFLPVDQLEQTPQPARWTVAVVYDARDTWNAGRRDGDVIGFDTYAVRVRPLSDTVQGLLRPRRGRPSVG